MGFLRLFYRYVIRENWLTLTGRESQANSEADAWAHLDMDKALAAVREQPSYRRYLKNIEEWKERFDATVSKVEEGDPQRRMSYTSDDLAELPEVPRPAAVHFSSPEWDVTALLLAMESLWNHTTMWREDRLRRAAERLGLP